MKSIRVFLTLTLLSVAALLDFAAALRGYDRGMVEAEALFNQRMYQHLDLLNYTLPDLLARGDIRNGRLSLPLILQPPGACAESPRLDHQGRRRTHTQLAGLGAG